MIHLIKNKWYKNKQNGTYKIEVSILWHFPVIRESGFNHVRILLVMIVTLLCFVGILLVEVVHKGWTASLLSCWISYIIGENITYESLDKKKTKR